LTTLAATLATLSGLIAALLLLAALTTLAALAALLAGLVLALLILLALILVLILIAHGLPFCCEETHSLDTQDNVRGTASVPVRIRKTE
jgi:hypothetical protein